MKLLKKYFKAIHEIYDYFGYETGEKILPLEDYTEFEWYYNEDEEIIYFRTIGDKDIFSETGKIYFGEYDDSEMIMFEIFDDALLIFDAHKEIYIEE